MLFTFIIIVAVFLLAVLLIQSSKVIYIRLLLIPALCIAFIICLMFFSDAALESAIKGLNLWASVVVPSLFPFFVAAEIMHFSGFTRAAGVLLEPVMRPLFSVPGCASFAFALGISSGYPVGARIASDMRKSGALTKTEAERLLAFTNNSGPLFIIGAVGTGMYGSSSIGLLLFICHLLSCITVGILFKYYKHPQVPADRTGKFRSHVVRQRKERHRSDANIKQRDLLYNFKNKLIHENNVKSNFGTLLGNAVKSSVSTVLAIGGFIVLFSVIASLLRETGIIKILSNWIASLLSALSVISFNEIIEGALSGILEITSGSSLVSQTISVPADIRLPTASFIIGWAGISVHCQVISIVSDTDISIRPYLFGKLVQGIIAAIYTWVGIKLFDFASLASAPVLGIRKFDMQSFFVTLGKSLWLLITVLLVWICINRAMQNRKSANGR